MSHIAKLFMDGRSQAVRLPSIFRFDGDEVYIRQDPETGDIILSKKPNDWDSFLQLQQQIDVPDDFLSQAERQQNANRNDPFESWKVCSY